MDKDETYRLMRATIPELSSVPEWILYALYASFAEENLATWLSWSEGQFRAWVAEQRELS